MEVFTITDNMKDFLEAASKDDALKADVKALAAKFDSKPADEESLQAAAIELAAKHGFTLTEDDFKFEEMTELTEDEMNAVAGGTQVCACGIYGEGGEEGGPDIDCFCVIGGGGHDFSKPDRPTCCACPVAGFGIVTD
ncbi:MAG: hypothetical protein IJS39_12690 [Synergistaceae bacterium]|nr:hypothetical protein [Synergistaceae bacterium]